MAMRLAFILAMIAAGSPALAEEWDVCADRPGLASNACVIPAGAVQLESSLASWSLDRREGVRTSELAIGPSLLRIGVASGIELRAGLTPYDRVVEQDSSGRSTASGASDLDLALKFRLLTEDSPVGLALQPGITLPVGARSISEERWSASLTIPVDMDLGGPFSLSLTPRADWIPDSDGHGRHGGVAVAASLGAALGDRLSMALDAAHDVDFDPDGTATATAAGLSAAWMATPRLQLDAEVDAGLGGEAPDVTLVAGFAFRF